MGSCGNRLREHLVETTMQGMGELLNGSVLRFERFPLLLSLVNHSTDRDLGVTCDVGEYEII